MKFARIFISLLVVTMFFSCGGDDDTTTTNNPNTSGGTSLATLSIVDAKPSNGNGVLKLTRMTSDVEPSGGDQVIHITGTTGADNEIKHQIDIHYNIYYVGGETRGEIKQISHAWGSTLTGSLDGGISVCNQNCTKSTITPSLNTLVFGNQVLDKTTDPSTLAGTIIYP